MYAHIRILVIDKYYRFIRINTDNYIDYYFICIEDLSILTLVKGPWKTHTKWFWGQIWPQGGFSYNKIVCWIFEHTIFLGIYYSKDR